MEGSLLTQLLLQVVLIGINALFACAEIAILSLNKSKIEKMALEGDKKSQRLHALIFKPEKFLATIQVGITLAGYLGAAFASNSFASVITGWFLDINPSLNATTINSVSVILVTLILAYFTLVFGELVPKRLAMKNSEKLGLAFSGILTFISKAFAPVVWLLTKSTNLVLRLVGVDPHADDTEVTEEEIRMLVEDGSEKGAIELEERVMIENIFEFDDTTIDEIMTHRIDVQLLWLEDGIEEWEKTISNSYFTRYPICSETADNIIGVLNTKYYFRLHDKTLENITKEAVSPAFFVPETATLNVLFANMQKTQKHFAIVLDEYGGMSGIITINDVIAEIVGEFDDVNIKKKDPDIKQLSDDYWLIQGKAHLDDVEDALGVSLDDEDADTFAGLILSELGRIPDDNEKLHLVIDNLDIQVLRILDRRIVSCKVKVIKKEETNGND